MGIVRAMGGGYAGDIDAHVPALRALALRLCGNAADADDLVQDTVETALKQLDRLVAGSNLRSWMLAVLHNRFVDLRRRRARRPAETPIDGLSLPDPGPDEGPPRWASVSAEQVQEALARLGADLRRVYELHAVERRSYDEIARALAIPRATVGTRLLRARRRLRELLTVRDES